MADLHSTPTRLALLREVDAGLVIRDRDGDWLDHDPQWIRVAGRVAELEAAGWVELGTSRPGGHITPWRLSKAGRAVLDANSAPRRGER